MDVASISRGGAAYTASPAMAGPLFKVVRPDIHLAGPLFWSNQLTNLGVSTQNIDFRMQKRVKHTSQMALVSFCVP